MVVVGDDEKQVCIFEASTKKLLATKTLPKRASKMIYTKSESELLITDKTGNVYSVCMDAYETAEVVASLVLMRHLSMLTDIKFTSDEKCLITSDRDEKIRISFYQNANNVQSYLLGHKEFVTQIHLIDDRNLVSVSGVCLF
jgi:tRNA (guanine-N(7)-)-methyltransferase subunit TRM82